MSVQCSTRLKALSRNLPHLSPPLACNVLPRNDNQASEEPRVDRRKQRLRAGQEWTRTWATCFRVAAEAPTFSRCYEHRCLRASLGGVPGAGVSRLFPPSPASRCCPPSWGQSTQGGLSGMPHTRTLPPEARVSRGHRNPRWDRSLALM